jgi:hypothetical protein
LGPFYRVAVALTSGPCASPWSTDSGERQGEADPNPCGAVSSRYRRAVAGMAGCSGWKGRLYSRRSKTAHFLAGRQRPSPTVCGKDRLGKVDLIDQGWADETWLLGLSSMAFAAKP